MAKNSKDLLLQLTSNQVEGPFVTIMLNTQVAFQQVEKSHLKFKNFVKEAKQRYEKRYPNLDWSVIQEKADSILNDRDFWRNGSKSLAIILTPHETFVHPLSIEVDDQYYVGDTPYLLAIIKNAQFNYSYYVLALNRDSMALYKMENKKLVEVPLPADAPTTLEISLGTERDDSRGVLHYRSSSNLGSHAGHGTNTKEEELEIDWSNYYLAVGKYLKDFFETEEKLPIFLYGLPENQTLFRKVVRSIHVDQTISVPSSPTQLSLQELEKNLESIQKELQEKEVLAYQRLMDGKYVHHLSDIKQSAKTGRIGQLFIATSNLTDGFGDDPDTEYDWRQELNSLSIDTLINGGDVYVLEQKNAPGQKGLIASLRY